MNFNGKVAVITGGGSGIGEACAAEFADRQAVVAIVDRDSKQGGQVAAALRNKGQSAEFFEADISLRGQVELLVQRIVERLGGIDVLVSNAGIQRYGTVTTLSEEEWDEVMNANLKSAFLMCKYAIPDMIRRGGGAIVITGSVQSVAAMRNSTHYVVSKHGLLGLTRCLALDYVGSSRVDLQACKLEYSIVSPK